MSLGTLKSLRKGAEGSPLACLYSWISLPWVLGRDSGTLPARDRLWGSSRVCRPQLQGRCTCRAAQLPTTQRFAAITIILKSLTTRLNTFTHSPFTLYLLLMAAQLISRPQRVWHCRCTEGQQVLALRSLQPNYKWQQMEGKHCEPFCFSLANLTQVTIYNQIETITHPITCHRPGCRCILVSLTHWVTVAASRTDNQVPGDLGLYRWPPVWRFCRKQTGKHVFKSTSVHQRT